MARIANTSRTIARNALAYIENEIHAVNRALSDSEKKHQELTDDGSFSTVNLTTYKTGRMNAAKTHNSNAVAMYRWLLDEFSIAIPAALDDAAVDALDEDIRTHDDGN